MKKHECSTHSHSFFLKGEDKVPKNWVGGEIFKKTCRGKQNGMVFFHFHFLTISYYGNTTFRKSSLGKDFLEKIVPGTSKNCQYCLDLLVFCLKFKLSPVCEYLNYCYNIANDWAIPEKSKQRGLRTLKKTWFVTLPLEILDKKKLPLPLDVL